jgi:thioredoxin-like negative regulator of GroEL
MTPIVDGLNEQYGKQITIKQVNADIGDGPKIIQLYRIPGHPTILIFDKEGEEVARLFGPQPAEIVEEALQKVLTK